MYYIIRLIHKHRPEYYYYTSTGNIVDYRSSQKYKQYKRGSSAINMAERLAKSHPFLNVTVILVDYEVKDYWPDDCTVASRYASTVEEARAIASSSEIRGTTEIVTRERSVYQAA